MPSNLEMGKDVFNNTGSITIANMTGPAHSAALLGAVNYHKDMANFSTRFLGLMRMAEVFGQTHASLPNIFLDSRLDDHVKDYLMAVSSRTQASVLIGNASTRSCFVARAINWYLVEKVLKISIIRGLDAAVDMEIGEMQKQIVSDTSIGIRHLMLNAIANHLKCLARRPDFNTFAKKKIDHHVTKLWSFVGPLGHDSANQNNMWMDLHAIITEAHCLAVEMYSVPLEYRFEFPEHNEPFDPFTMINRDPYIHGDPQVLQSGDARVRLAITPIVRIRNNSQSPGEVHLMYLGHVLLKVSRTQ
ncbi:hypothetical protein ASPSYDRAFT_127248 [Aspergillus sydowii CBS 593.65]|uniref:Uncharacterized protein n=1 Tax=Aspergillus sydowii CBS 593.65 TaxID=1036612 RepID=A0A1L9TWI8_9EURO|nr:uncharacterized protein ASPSYDRAFT_127248 [Aspergillus sydowii CBS 593.65]OJJ63814.1 hypothetical protein ASPSYDRAFT_127248 [Aspergillus sydowii CBS 593.65]